MVHVWRNHKPELALIVWTFFAWSNRLKNILDDHAHSAQLFVAVGFLLLAASSLFVLLAEKKFTTSVFTTWFLAALALFGIARWLYRAPVVLFGSESAAFRTVHTLLAMVTIVLSVWVLRYRKIWKT